MGLSADQQAMLQLLLERGQSYGDLASLLGVPEPDVRARARTALTDLGGADPDRNVALGDWLLGQADPIGRADVVRHLKDDPEDHRLAADLMGRLKEVAPDGQLPELPAPPRGGPARRRRAAVEAEPPAERAAARAAPAAQAPEPSASAEAAGPGLTSRQVRLMAALGCGALIVLVAVLAVAGVFDGDDEASPAPTAATGPQGNGADRVVAEVPLRPTGGGNASGQATFGIADGRGYMDLTVEGLERPPGNEAYIVWLLISPDRGHPLSAVAVDADGSFDERIRIEDFILEVAAHTRVVDVSLAPARELREQLQAAVQEGSPLLEYTGTSVLRGRVPLERNAGAGGPGGGQGSPG
jgi:hypothetical protein